MIVDYFRDFGVLKETGLEYWGIQIVNVLDCTFYFAMLTIVSVFLSEDLGLSDRGAGYSITIFTSATSIMLFFSGLCTDWLGIRKSLNFSLLAMLVLRVGMVVVGLTPSLPHRGILASLLLLLMAPFMAGIQTVFQSSCRRFTTKRSRSAGFNLGYLCMNIGAHGKFLERCKWLNGSGLVDKAGHCAQSFSRLGHVKTISKRAIEDGALVGRSTSPSAGQSPGQGARPSASGPASLFGRCSRGGRATLVC